MHISISSILQYILSQYHQTCYLANSCLCLYLVKLTACVFLNVPILLSLSYCPYLAVTISLSLTYCLHLSLLVCASLFVVYSALRSLSLKVLIIMPRLSYPVLMYLLPCCYVSHTLLFCLSYPFVLSLLPCSYVSLTLLFFLSYPCCSVSLILLFCLP